MNSSDEQYPLLQEVEGAAKRLDTDPVVALGELQRHADQGSVLAMAYVGVAYISGKGVPVDASQAEWWFRRAQSLGSMSGTFYLGSLYLNKKDYAKAREAYAACAMLGDVESVKKVQEIDDYLRGVANLQQEIYEYETVHAILARQKTDPEGVIAELQSLAENHSLRAMVALGWTYWKGVGTAVDLSQAEYWYGRACEESKGCGEVDKEAVYKCGEFYLQNHRYDMACASLQRGAALGHVGCLRMLARMYINGLGIDKDPEKGREYLERAAINGNVFAKRDLARLLLSGAFGWKNRVKGWRMFLRAAKEGFRIARYDPKDKRLKD